VLKDLNGLGGYNSIRNDEGQNVDPERNAQASPYIKEHRKMTHLWRFNDAKNVIEIVDNLADGEAHQQEQITGPFLRIIN
jgi:hypothetical protein